MQLSAVMSGKQIRVFTHLAEVAACRRTGEGGGVSLSLALSYL